nr:GNAT family N-acetyltransferase [uncultured Pedobacter sp.]
MNTTINWQPEDLKNEWVTLKPLVPSDFEDLYFVASDKLIWEQHPSFDRYQRDVFERFFKKAIEGQSAFLIRDSVTQEVIGSSRFYNDDPADASIAIGYTFLARKYWGTAVNKSVKMLMINYAFKQGIKNLLFHVGATNLRSQKAVQKLGAIKIKEFTKEDKGVKTHHIEFAINHKDWDKQK